MGVTSPLLERMHEAVAVIPAQLDAGAFQRFAESASTAPLPEAVSGEYDEFVASTR